MAHASIKNGSVNLQMTVGEAAAVAAIIGVSTGSNLFLGRNSFPVYMALLDVLKVHEDDNLYKKEPSGVLDTKKVFGDIGIEGLNIGVDSEGCDI